MSQQKKLSGQVKKILKRAMLKMKKGALKEAEADFKKVLKLNPRLVSALNNLGSINLFYAKYETASLYFKKALNIDNHNIYALSSLGIIYLFYYNDRKMAMNYVMQAYNHIFSMDIEQFMNYFEYYDNVYLSILIAALGLLDEHKKIINLDKKFWLLLHQYLLDVDLLNIAIAYANEGSYKNALNLMEMYELTNKYPYKSYYNLIEYLLEHDIRLKLDYFVLSSFLGGFEHPIWNKIRLSEKGFFSAYYHAFSDKRLSELAWDLLSNEVSFYDKEVIIELLFATERNDYLHFLNSLLHSENIPLDLKISLYVIETMMGYVLYDDEIDELNDKKLKEFIKEYHRCYIYNDELINEQDRVIILRKAFNVLYKLHEKYPNHMIYMMILTFVHMLVIEFLEEGHKKGLEKSLNLIDKVIMLARSMKNPFYMLDIASIFTLLGKDYCNKALDTILNALDLLKTNKPLPTVYQLSLFSSIAHLKLAKCKTDTTDIAEIEKVVSIRNLIDHKKIEFISAKTLILGLRRWMEDIQLSHKRMYKKYFERDVSPDMSLEDLLSNYTVSLLTGIAKHLKSIGIIKTIKRKKKELVEEIVTAISNNIKEIIINLKEKKLKNAFKYLLQHQGFIEFNKFAAIYGSDEEDDLNWEYVPPRSTLGRLKLAGIVFVGMYMGKKIVFIPHEILARIDSLNI